MIIQIGTEVDESRILWKRKESDEWERADIDELIEAYENEQKEGEWEVVPRIPLDNYKCSECGAYSNFDFNYCPNCGAKMRLE